MKPSIERPDSHLHGSPRAAVRAAVVASRPFAAGLAVALSASACTDMVVMPAGPVLEPVTTMSYNVANSMGQAQGVTIAAHIAEVGADFVAGQEVNDGPWLLGQLPGRYDMTDAPDAGVALLYDTSRWHVRDQGTIVLGDNDDGWGRRVATWALFADADDRGVRVYSTHWCVPIRTPDDPCDAARQLDYVAAILATMDPDIPTIVAGDLNVFDGFADSAPVQALLESGLVDTVAAFGEDADEITFMGNSWAPAGRIDYIVATAPVDVLAAWVDTDSLEPGTGSDHHPVNATVAFGAPP